MPNWEKVFEFGDSTTIACVNPVTDGLIVSGWYNFYKPNGNFLQPDGSPTPWSPSEGFICKVSLVGNDLVWLTQLNRFVPLSHVCTDDHDRRIFVTGRDVAPATADIPERSAASAFREIDSCSGQVIGKATIIDRLPREPKWVWHKRYFLPTLVIGDSYLQVGEAQGESPTFARDENVLRLPFILTVDKSSLTHRVTVLGDRMNHVALMPTASCVTEEETLLVAMIHKTIYRGGHPLLGDARLEIGCNKPTKLLVRRIINAANPLNPTVFQPLLVPWQKVVRETQGESGLTSICDTGHGGFVITGWIEQMRVLVGGQYVYDKNGFVEKFDGAGNSTWLKELSMWLPFPDNPAIGRDSAPRGLMWFGNWFAIWGSAPTGEMFLAKFLDKGADPPELEWQRRLARPIPPRPFPRLGHGVVAAENGGVFYAYGQIDQTESHVKAYIGRLGATGELA